MFFRNFQSRGSFVLNFYSWLFGKIPWDRDVFSRDGKATSDHYRKYMSLNTSRSFFTYPIWANEILSKTEVTGTFLVRFSKTYGDSMALSVLYNGPEAIIKHFRIFYEDPELAELHEHSRRRFSFYCWDFELIPKILNIPKFMFTLGEISFLKYLTTNINYL